MPFPSPDALRLAEVWRLGLEETRTRGPAGERLGSGTGSSLEFQDQRAYAPGDDVRHLDWRAYARTDQLTVRLYREEILPRVEILVDGSRSMTVEPAKAQLAVDLAALLEGAARAGGHGARVILLGERVEPLEPDRLRSEGLAFDARSPLADAAAAAAPLLRPGATRLVISDFLSPHDARALVRGLSARCGTFACLQVLGADDAAPPAGTAQRLTDSETGEVIDLVLDQGVVERYLARLGRLRDELQAECRRAHGRFVSLTVGPSLDELCRTLLATESVLVPA